MRHRDAPSSLIARIALPLALVALIPSLVGIYQLGGQNEKLDRLLAQGKATDRALCVRTEEQKEVLRRILTELIDSGAVFRASSRSPQVRAYFAAAVPRITEARVKAARLPCPPQVKAPGG